MLKNIYLKTLRDNRWSILIWGVASFGLMQSIIQGYKAFFSGTDFDKQVAEVEKIYSSFSVLLGKVYDLNTVGGFTDARFIGIMPILYSIFALLAGSGIIRGEEEKNSLDLLSSTPHSRTSVILQKIAAIFTVLLAINLLAYLGLLVGFAALNQPIPFVEGGLALFGVALVTALFASIALFLSQFMSRKAAAGWTGGILAGTYVVNNVVNNVPSLDWLHYLSPFYYFNLSKPLAVSVGTNWTSYIVLGILIVPVVALAVWMYNQRDHNSNFTLFKSQTVKAAEKAQQPKAVWLANNFTYSLRAMLPGALIWGLSISLYVVFIMAVFNDIRTEILNLLNSSDLYKNFGFSGFSDGTSLLGLMLFTFLVLIVAAYAVTQIASWASEENDGKLELVLSTPVPRWQLLLGRFLATILMSALMIGIIALTYWVGAALGGVEVNNARSFESFFGMWVLCIIIAAAGYIWAAFQPGLAVTIIGGLVMVSYLVQLLAKLLGLPGWLVNLSIFTQYGEPMRSGLNWSAQLVMLGLAVAFVAVAVFRFSQRDITK
jgi:ABC-2 type transport system permease protein